jgi:hypothetical protein
MKYVLGVSVAICWVIPRPLSPKAVKLRDECAGHYWAPPHLGSGSTQVGESNAISHFGFEFHCCILVFRSDFGQSNPKQG